MELYHVTTKIRQKNLNQSAEDHEGLDDFKDNLVESHHTIETLAKQPEDISKSIIR